jgi:hypothetical protein
MSKDIASFLLVFALFSGWSHAREVRVKSVTASGRVTISVNGVPCITLASGAGSLSVQDRADLIRSRLERWAGAGANPKFGVARKGSSYRVTGVGEILAVPTVADSKRLGLKRRSTAHRWAATLQRAWNTPFLTLSPSGAVIGMGMSRSFQVGGGASGPVYVRSEPEGLVSIKQSGRTITLTGRNPGQGSISVIRDGASVTSALLVLKLAGSVRPVQLEVTGGSVPRDVLEEAFSYEIDAAMKLEPGCGYKVTKPPAFPAVWSRGDRLTLNATVYLHGPQRLAVTRSVPISIQRRKVDRATGTVLFYSNNPERVTAPQTLFRQTVVSNTNTRLLYHHQNGTSNAMNLGIDIYNPGDRSVYALVVDGTGPVTPDTVLTGHVAAYRYLKRHVDGVGIVLRIPPGARRRVVREQLRVNDTASGILMVRPLSGGNVLLTAAAEHGPETDRAPAQLVKTDAVFPSPDKTIEAEYEVGKTWAHIALGRHAISNQNGTRLSGNYGVVYTVKLRLENPTASSRKVQVLFEAKAGAARGAFLVDGKLVQTPMIYPPAEVKITDFHLRAGERRNVTIITLPAAGGSYPAGIIVHG